MRYIVRLPRSVHLTLTLLGAVLFPFQILDRGPPALRTHPALA
jgi:hypothetical protein